jgi:hypothetical protein
MLEHWKHDDNDVIMVVVVVVMVVVVEVVEVVVLVVVVVMMMLLNATIPRPKSFTSTTKSPFLMPKTKPHVDDITQTFCNSLRLQSAAAVCHCCGTRGGWTTGNHTRHQFTLQSGCCCCD